MSSKVEILEKIKQSQPTERVKLPNLDYLEKEDTDIVEKYKMSLKSIGGYCIEVANYQCIIDYVKIKYFDEKRIITTIKELSKIASTDWVNDDPHTLANVDLTLVKAHFGVAENGAVWITDAILGQRIAVFIPQNLAIVVHKKDIVSTMHQGYDRIGNQDYGFGTFVAGPSKTADIEQSLVLGAHGARSLIVFLMD